MASEAKTAAPRRFLFALALCGLLCTAAHAYTDAPSTPGISGPPAQSVGVRHAASWTQLQALAGKRVSDPAAARVLGPPLSRALDGRYKAFTASMSEDKPLRVEGSGLIGEGVVPDSLGYRGSFFIFGKNGAVFAALKSGRHGTTIERFGSLEVLKDPTLLHAYQEFIGIDE
ncbi:hypothetical protein [Noviherbaspirillum pedocola]|uniref:Uncharacterized protein n=1 Tax=Noviherbaspirillum pedocola TaxID=2801341 RepID=A0A934W9X8_9BURK|nr:hypothetical protein [Noviherbaspirillum pedocola]MBK4737784.1 hypothetical protein [Noviherbaspirillum pedocola]